MQQDIRILKQKCNDLPMFLPSLVKLGPRTPEKSFASCDPFPKIARKNVLNRQ